MAKVRLNHIRGCDEMGVVMPGEEDQWPDLLDDIDSEAFDALEAEQKNAEIGRARIADTLFLQKR